MARQSYQRLSPADIDEIWVRLQGGHAAKPTARALGMPTSTVRAYLIRCGGIRPDPRCRGAGRLSLAEREEISRVWRRAGRCGRSPPSLGRSPSTISREVACQRWSSSVPGGGGGPAGVDASDATQAVQARDQPEAGWHRGREAPASVVTAADRRLAEADLSRRPGDAGVPREHLPRAVRAVAWCSAQGADRLPAHGSGDQAGSGDAVARRPWGPARDLEHLRTARRGQPTGRCPGTGKATWSSAST